MMPRCLTILVPAVALAACGQGVPEPTDDAVPEPTPYIVEEEEDTEVEVDLDTIEVQVQQTLDRIWTLNANPIFAAYDNVKVAQTDDCPRTYTQNGNDYWFDQCTTDEGVSFSGYGFYYDYVAYPISEEFTGDVEVLSGAAQVQTADGHVLDVAGSAQVLVADHNVQPARYYQTVLRGTFSWDGPEAEGTWLEDDIAPDLMLQAYRRTDVGGSLVTLDGGLSIDGGTSAVVFDNTSVIEQSLGGICEREASGVVSVRNAEGLWVDLVFDGPDPQTFQGDPAACDGVGRAYLRGEEIGTVEVDFSTVFFAEAPW